MVSTSSLKNWKKTENFLFQIPRTFVFHLKVASKPFSKKLPMNEGFLEALSCFRRKQFQLRHSKICKKMKNAIFKRSEHLFLSSK